MNPLQITFALHHNLDLDIARKSRVPTDPWLGHKRCVLNSAQIARCCRSEILVAGRGCRDALGGVATARSPARGPDPRAHGLLPHNLLVSCMAPTALPLVSIAALNHASCCFSSLSLDDDSIRVSPVNLGASLHVEGMRVKHSISPVRPSSHDPIHTPHAPCTMPTLPTLSPGPLGTGAGLPAHLAHSEDLQRTFLMDVHCPKSYRQFISGSSLASDSVPNAFHGFWMPQISRLHRS